MKALITGGLGFIGSNFILQLLEKNQNIQITNVDGEFHGSNSQNLVKIKNNLQYKYVKGNINDIKLMENLIKNNDVIINFAAESFVDRSISNAIPFLESNVNGVFTILELIKKNRKRFVHISTDEVYGSLKKGSAVEETRFNPSSPYSATKAAAELLINSYAKTYDSDCLITRCTNNYGPRQFAEKLIPKTIMLAYYEKEIPIYGTGKNIRDWLYVEDHCLAIEKILYDGKKGESYNISGNNEIDNITIVKEILELMNKSEDLITFVEDRPGHDFRYSMESKKIRNELKWSHEFDFKEGIKKTVKWYLDNKEWWKDISKEVFSSTPWKN
jgi:dTDP-glucose 4,6-dehydratase